MYLLHLLDILLDILVDLYENKNLLKIIVSLIFIFIKFHETQDSDIKKKRQFAVNRLI